MKHKVFSIFDVKSGIFNPPFMCRATGEAVRSFSQLANDKTTQVGMYPEDYILFEIGLFDDETAVYEQDKPQSLGHATIHVVGTALSPKVINMKRKGKANA